MCVRESAHICRYVYLDALWSQKSVCVIPWSCLVWELGPELRSSGGIGRVVNSRASSPVCLCRLCRKETEQYELLLLRGCNFYNSVRTIGWEEINLKNLKCQSVFLLYWTDEFHIWKHFLLFVLRQDLTVCVPGCPWTCHSASASPSAGIIRVCHQTWPKTALKRHKSIGCGFKIINSGT